MWTDPGLKIGINLCELISTLKKKAQEGNELSSILPKSSHTRKKPPPLSLIIVVCHQDDLPWSLTRGGLSSGWSFVSVVVHGGGLPWSFIRLVFLQGGLPSVSSGLSFVKVFFHQVVFH